MQITLVALAGLPCSGKSSLAELIAKTIGWPVFSVDPIESAMHRAGIPSNFERGLAAYLVAENLADENLKQGVSVIIDASNYVRPAREIWSTLAEKHQARLVFIECSCPTKIHQQRVQSRVRDMPGFPEITWPDILQRISETDPWEVDPIKIDTSDMTSALSKALKALSS